MRMAALLAIALCTACCSEEPTNRVHRFGVDATPTGTYRGSVELALPGRISHDSLTVVISPPIAVVYLRSTALATTVDSLTSTAVWLTCQYDDCTLRLRTYPGRVGVGADSLRGSATLCDHDGYWSAIR